MGACRASRSCPRTGSAAKANNADITNDFIADLNVIKLLSYIIGLSLQEEADSLQ